MIDNRQIKEYLNRQKHTMVALLEELVCTRDAQKKCGDHIIARSPKFDPVQKQVLITGHMDTVFPADTDFTFFRQDEAHTYGPGVADMKGGLVVGIYALKALSRLKLLDDANICFVFNSDEEIGSVLSRQLIETQAQKSKVGLVLEAGGLHNELVTGRKGNICGTLSIEGRAGHAAFAGPQKASAVLELAHKAIEFEALNRVDRGISVNVGMVKGGIGPNTVAQYASAKIDFRFLNPEDEKSLKDRINTICNTRVVPGTTPRFDITRGRPPMQETKENLAIFDRIKVMAKDFDYHVVSERRPGVSDANFIANQGVPVIDGLGSLGARDHSEDEYIITQSLVDRAVLFVNILCLAVNVSEYKTTGRGSFLSRISGSGKCSIIAQGLDGRYMSVLGVSHVFL